MPARAAAAPTRHYALNTPPPDAQRLRAFIKRGGVIAYATESCYGLGCDPRNRSAVLRILRMKRRPQGKGLILIGSDVAQFRRFLAPLPAALADRLDEWWPGPNTLLLPAAKSCPRWLRGAHDKLAVRVSAHRDAARLCKQVGMALVSTSANQAGKRPLKSAAACAKAFGAKIWAIPGRIGRRKRPSRIIDPGTGDIFRR